MNVNNYQNVYFQNKKLIEEYRKAYRLTDRDNVQIFTLPKGKAGKKAGSFLFKTMSAKALRLQSNVYRIKRKIRDLENSNVPRKEKSDSLNRLRALLKYTEGNLNAEIAALPRSGFIVVEEEE